MNRSFYHRNPQYLETLPEQYAVNVKGSEVTTQLYSVMPLKLLKAAELLGGEDKLDAVLAELFQNTESDNFPYLHYDDFLNASGLTREDLSLD